MPKDDEQELLQTFGTTVRRYREALGLSQEKLAEVSGLHRTYISDLERGNRNASLINIVRLAEALSLSAGELLNGLP